MQIRAAAVACRQLGFPLGGVPYTYGQQGSTSLPVVAANLVCKGTENRLHVSMNTSYLPNQFSINLVSPFKPVLNACLTISRAHLPQGMCWQYQASVVNPMTVS